MKLCLKGHDYKYAVEQVFLMFFPREKPRYEAEPPEGEDYSLITLENEGGLYTASSVISLDGRLTEVRAQASPDPNDDLRFHRELQRCIKKAYYSAASRATGKEAPWGAMTGIRPVKVPVKLISEGRTREEAEGILRDEYFVSPEKAALAIETAEASIRAKESLEKNDVSLYVGIPFCPTRCSYCSFVSSSVQKSLGLIEPYLEALFKEIEAAARLVQEAGLRIVTVYIGGGTPTTLNALQLEALLTKLRREFDFSSVREFTVEAGRADTIDEDKLRAIKAGGVNRISINPQTMDDNVLRAAGRSHTTEQVEKAFEIARQVGFDVINADLIAGLPTDTPEGFRRSLGRLLSLRPENVTVHTLALKKGSKLSEGGFLPSEEDVRAMLETSEKLLRAADYGPYYLYRQKFTAGNFENLGWCLPGTESLYNICIMEELHTIISLGGGGVTKLVAPKCGRIERIFNAKYPYEYINAIQKEIEAKEYLKTFLNRYE
jgi:oxygen-independent coproporphyrinogen-3 oxidase